MILLAHTSLKACEMTPIKNWRAVAPFAGKVVAYSTSTMGELTQQQTQPKFGFVSEKSFDHTQDPWSLGSVEGECYTLYQLLKKDEADKRACFLNYGPLSNSSMQIRVVTEAEGRTIFDAVANCNAYFNWHSGYNDYVNGNAENSPKKERRILKLLKKQLHFTDDLKAISKKKHEIYKKEEIYKKRQHENAKKKPPSKTEQEKELANCTIL